MEGQTPAITTDKTSAPIQPPSAQGQQSDERLTQVVNQTNSDRRGLLDISVKLSNPNPTAGKEFTVYVEVINLFDVPIWPQSPQVFLPTELKPVFSNNSRNESASLQALFKATADGNITARPRLRNTVTQNWFQKNIPTLFPTPLPDNPVDDILKQLAGISHLVCNPRTAWVVFVIFCLLPGFARHFSSPPLVFARRGRCFDAIVGSKAHFLPTVKTPPPWLPWFSCNSFHFSSSGCCCW